MLNVWLKFKTEIFWDRTNYKNDITSMGVRLIIKMPKLENTVLSDLAINFRVDDDYHD